MRSSSAHPNRISGRHSKPTALMRLFPWRMRVREFHLASGNVCSIDLFEATKRQERQAPGSVCRSSLWLQSGLEAKYRFTNGREGLDLLLPLVCRFCRDKGLWGRDRGPSRARTKVLLLAVDGL